MQKPLLILVTGLSATGKSTLSKKLAAEFHLPFVSKDILKELLFDTIGWSDREWSKKIGIGSYAIMDYWIQQELGNGHSLIIESNFKPEYDNKKFQKWQHKYGFDCIQIFCKADSDVLVERFKRRSETDRHPGHGDADNYDEFIPILQKGKWEPLAIQGEIITFDTTDFSKADDTPVFEKVRDMLKS